MLVLWALGCSIVRTTADVSSRVQCPSMEGASHCELHELSQRCYCYFPQRVDFFTCQTEICGARNATVAMLGSYDTNAFVAQRVVRQQATSSCSGNESCYHWLGAYRLPMRRESWAWVANAGGSSARSMVSTSFWDRDRGYPVDYAGSSNCAIADSRGVWYDMLCSGFSRTLGRLWQVGHVLEAKFACVCQFPSAPHPDWELDLEQMRAYVPPLSHTLIDMLVIDVNDILKYILVGFLGVMLLCSLYHMLVVQHSSSWHEAFLHALLIYPLCLAMTARTKNSGHVSDIAGADQGKRTQDSSVHSGHLFSSMQRTNAGASQNRLHKLRPLPSTSSCKEIDGDHGQRTIERDSGSFKILVGGELPYQAGYSVFAVRYVLRVVLVAFYISSASAFLTTPQRYLSIVLFTLHSIMVLTAIQGHSLLFRYAAQSVLYDCESIFVSCLITRQ